MSSTALRIRRAAKGLLRSAGYDIHRTGTLALGRTMSSVLRHLSAQGFEPATVVDVGVGNGTPELYETFPRSRYLLIEPLQEFDDAIGKISQQVNASWEMACAGDHAGVTTIAIHADLLASSSLSESDASDISYLRREVPVVTIDSVVDGDGAAAPLLIKLDVQGAEIDALRGARGVLATTEVVVTEVSLFRSHVGGQELFDVLAWMKEHGFVAYDIFGGHCRPFDGALAQVDIVFVKEQGRFREHHGYR